jgi:F420H(2)-dependent biliverdin reductase
MALDPHDLPPTALEFLRERHLATLTTTRSDGRLHVVAVGFTFDAGRGVARVITWSAAQKARNAGLGVRAAVAQVDGPRWISLEGPVTVKDDAESVAAAVAAYAGRYRQPKERADRVVIEITVEQVLASRFS